MRIIQALLALLSPDATPLLAQGLALPFDGRWFVAQGGDTPNVNHHIALESQWYAIDFAQVGGPTDRDLTRGARQRVEDFYGWSAEVLAPAAGVVVAVENDLPDNTLGVHDKAHPAGNHVVLQSGQRFYYLAHFRRGSVRVRVGDSVARGQVLAQCGNSGNSDFPHVHLHATQSPQLGEGRGENMTFAGITVELSGKQFIDVEWPMIRGLFVSNRCSPRR